MLEPDVLLMTDGHAAYRQFASAAGIRHAFVNLRAGERVRGEVHVQNVNGYHSRLRAWMHHFRRRHALPGQLLRLALGY